jgi:iron complex outermembrane receptor protein
VAAIPARSADHHFAPGHETFAAGARIAMQSTLDKRGSAEHCNAVQGSIHIGGHATAVTQCIIPEISENFPAGKRAASDANCHDDAGWSRTAAGLPPPGASSDASPAGVAGFKEGIPMNGIASRAIALHGLAVALALLLSGTARANADIDAGAEAEAEDLASLSLEELGNIRVTSVSKKAERLADAAASLYVITGDDIRRSGARTLPEALRLAPNLFVARQHSAGYAITARGMSSSNFSAPNKLLVMVDGRSVYTPLFSGVFWDAQDLVLEDVERIEVVSGPGGTLWGVNAVNGVINIITRGAADTQGTLVSAQAGTASDDLGFHHGAALGAVGHYRVYAKHARRDHTRTAAGLPVDDAGRRTIAGFRADWDTGGDQWSLDGQAYRGSQGQPLPGTISISGVELALDDVDFSGGHLKLEWQRPLDAGGRLEAQAYYDRSRRSVPPTFSEHLSIYDLQFQHALAAHGRHALVWGLNHRASDDRIDNSPYFAFLPAEASQQWSALFAQDEILLRPGLRAIAGLRLERNDYTGTEVLPNVRLAWNVAPDHLLWAAASRAVRAPSRLDVDSHIPGEPPFLLDGGRAVRSEIANVYQLGYRGRVGERFALSGTLFHNDYDHLRTLEIDPTFSFVEFGSNMEGRTTGLEAWGTWRVTDAWRLVGGFTLLDQAFRLKPGSDDAAGPASAGFDPERTWQLRSSADLGEGVAFDFALRHASQLVHIDVPAYTTMDARLGWQVSDALEIALVGRNLLGGVEEFGRLPFRSEFGREFGLTLAWRP